MCHSACNFMDLFKALCGVICEASFYRPAVCLDSTLATICYQRAKVRWRVLFRDYQVTDFILSSFCLATIQLYFFFFIPCSVPGLTSILLPLSSSLSLSLSQPSLFQSLSKKNVSFEFYLKIAMGNTCNGCKNNSNKKCPPWLGNYLNHKEKKNIRRGIRMREKRD